MEIKISAEDMLYVLVEAGMDATEAKAIIFDLLQVPKDGISREAIAETRVNLTKAKNKRMGTKRKVVAEVPDEEEEEEEEEDDDDEEEDAEEVEPKKPIKNTVLKKNRPKRINFSSFGGPAEPLLG